MTGPGRAWTGKMGRGVCVLVYLPFGPVDHTFDLYRILVSRRCWFIQ